jgi:hypothetical protein
MRKRTHRCASARTRGSAARTGLREGGTQEYSLRPPALRCAHCSTTVGHYGARAQVGNPAKQKAMTAISCVPYKDMCVQAPTHRRPRRVCTETGLTPLFPTSAPGLGPTSAPGLGSPLAMHVACCALRGIRRAPRGIPSGMLRSCRQGCGPAARASGRRLLRDCMPVCIPLLPLTHAPARAACVHACVRACLPACACECVRTWACECVHARACVQAHGRAGHVRVPLALKVTMRPGAHAQVLE